MLKHCGEDARREGIYINLVSLSIQCWHAEALGVAAVGQSPLLTLVSLDIALDPKMCDTSKRMKRNTRNLSADEGSRGQS